MVKRAILAVAAVFIAWSILDFVIHGLLLGPTYEATANLWRPMEEMKMSLMHLVNLVYTICFVAIYGFVVSEKSFPMGIKYGALYGLATGISMGFGTYCVQPIPVHLAWTWLIGTFVECIVAGALIGAILKSGQATS